jgi:Spy/CpxP family protein refolding chaperone
MQELNLTQEQMQRLDALQQQSKKQMEQPRQALRQARQDLANLMASNADENAIRAKHNQLQQLQQQMANVRFQNMLEMRKVLTPEQRQRFAQLMQQRRGNSPNRAGSPRAPQQ